MNDRGGDGSWTRRKIGPGVETEALLRETGALSRDGLGDKPSQVGLELRHLAVLFHPRVPGLLLSDPAVAPNGRCTRKPSITKKSSGSRLLVD